MKNRFLKYIAFVLAIFTLSAFVVACGNITQENKVEETQKESSTSADSETDEKTAQSPLEKMIGEVLSDDLKVSNLEGEKLTLKSILDKEKYTFMTVWATWCPVCADHYPLIEEIAKDEKYNSKFSYITLNATAAEHGTEKKEQAKKYIEKNQYTLPVYFDETAEVILGLGLSEIPVGILLSPEGKVIHIFTGSAQKLDNLKEIMDLYIEELYK